MAFAKRAVTRRIRGYAGEGWVTAHLQIRAGSRNLSGQSNKSTPGCQCFTGAWVAVGSGEVWALSRLSFRSTAVSREEPAVRLTEADSSPIKPAPE
jgi:hypothetical protein